MYEHRTFETILQDMLNRVPGTVDKREGSVIYDALAPAAFELALMYAELDTVLRLGFGETASGEFLDLRALDFGVERKPAAPAVRKGTFQDEESEPFDVPIGSRFACEQVVFVVREQLAPGEFEMECESVGEIGNSVSGLLLPIDYIAGLAVAELAEVLVPGEDEESDDALRARYLDRVRNPSSGGNAADYRNWAREVPGVGGAKVYPLWDGPGTVKVVIVDSDMQSASPTLVSEAADYIESLRPVGADVTVVAATALEIEITATITVAPGYTLQSVSDSFTAAVGTHFRNITFVAPYVSIAQIGTLLLGIPGVLDYADLELNGDTSNVPLDDEEIPELTDVELEV